MVLAQKLLDNMKNYIQSIKTLISLFIAKKETRPENDVDDISEQQIEVTN